MRTSCLGRLTQSQNAHVHEQTAIAIFGKTGQPIEFIDLDACGPQWLDERICEPLRKLVQWNETIGDIASAERGMMPGIAQLHAGKCQPVWPNRGKVQEKRVQNRWGGDGVAGAGAHKIIEQSPRTDLFATSKDSRIG